jgi:hypothetical protein
MSIVLSALGVAFAAFCVWLAVRIVNWGERWAKWTALAVAVTFVYPISFGPVCWWFCRPVSAQPTDPFEGTNDERMTLRLASNIRVRIGCSQAIFVPNIYSALGWIARTLGGPADEGLAWYGRLALPPRTAMLIPAKSALLLR